MFINEKNKFANKLLPRPFIAPTIYCPDHLLPRPLGRGIKKENMGFSPKLICKCIILNRL